MVSDKGFPTQKPAGGGGGGGGAEGYPAPHPYTNASIGTQPMGLGGLPP